MMRASHFFIDYAPLKAGYSVLNYLFTYSLVCVSARNLEESKPFPLKIAERMKYFFKV